MTVSLAHTYYPQSENLWIQTGLSGDVWLKVTQCISQIEIMIKACSHTNSAGEVALAMLLFVRLSN